MQTYVSVPVPESLVPAVIQLVAQHLIDSGESTNLTGDGWADLDPEVPYCWWEELRPAERNLLRAFVDSGGSSLESSAVADAMGISTADLAGVLGPFQRRMNRDGFPVVLQSKTESLNGKRVKVLSIDAGALEVVRALDDGTDSPRPVVIKPAKVRG
ncbi:MAG: hypothetical protein KDA95_03230 [Acidimicrobiales bacterium]|nr:hypothetical protein [Acidimicrobiales bacterium]